MTGPHKNRHIPEIPLGVEEPAVLERELPALGGEDPPAVIDNSANPTDGGEDRNTEYTFFYNKKGLGLRY